MSVIAKQRTIYAYFQQFNQEFNKKIIKKLNEISQFMRNSFVFLVFFDDSNNCFIN